MRAHTAPLQRCYEKELAKAPTLKGRVLIAFDITPSGRTADLEVEENTLGSEAVGSCLKAVIRAWVLPFRPAEATRIAYPFVFSPAS